MFHDIFILEGFGSYSSILVETLFTYLPLNRKYYPFGCLVIVRLTVLSPMACKTSIGSSSSSLCVVQFNSIIMPEMTYFRLVHKAIDLYNEGKLEGALDPIEKFGGMVDFPDDFVQRLSEMLKFIHV